MVEEVNIKTVCFTSNSLQKMISCQYAQCITWYNLFRRILYISDSLLLLKVNLFIFQFFNKVQRTSSNQKVTRKRYAL